MAGLTFMDQRKINEQNLKEMKSRMNDHIKKKTQEFRMLEDAIRLEAKKTELTELEEKQQEVLK